MMEIIVLAICLYAGLNAFYSLKDKVEKKRKKEE